MPKTNSNVKKPRINTRGYAQRIRNENVEMKRTTSKPTWNYPRTPEHAKELLTKRIKAVLPHLQNTNIAEEWKQMNRDNRLNFPSLLSFAVDTMNLRSVRKVPGQQNSSFIKRAQFQIPFSIKLENKDWEAIEESSKVSVSSKMSSLSSGSTKKASSHTKLKELCMESFESPMVYASVEKVKNNTKVWATKVTHPSSDRVYGYAESKNKTFSREMAATHALRDLVKSLEDSTHVPAQQQEELSEHSEESQNTEDEPPASIELSEDLDSFDRQLLNITFIQEQALSAVEQRFENMLIKQLNKMTDFFDSRIKMAMDETVQTTIIPIIEDTVKQQITALQKDTIKAEINQHFQQKLTDDNLITTVTNKINDDLATTIKNSEEQIQKTAEQHIQSLKTEFEKAHTQFIKTELENIQSVKTEFEKAKQDFNLISQRDIAQLIDDRHDVKTELHNKYEEYISSMQHEKSTMTQQYNTYVVNMQNETNNHIKNITSAAENVQRKTQQTSNASDFFTVNDKVLYKDDFTGQECMATVVDIHNEEEDIVFYTLKFPTGRERRTDSKSIRRYSPMEAPMCNRFDKVDRSLLQPTQVPTSSTVVPPEYDQIATAYPEPTGFDIRSFQRQFKAPLRSDDDIITFYLQLKSQGETYNIYLIDIKDVQPERDLCPAEVPKSARQKMSLAIFQKIQDENTRDVTYTELENIMDTFSITSDGYEALQELLRRVHPNLNEDNDEYKRLTLSQCDYNPYALSKQLRNYFTQEEINLRPYSSKEKAKIYLESLDDEKYKDAKTQCLLDLNIATMHNKNVISKTSLTFNALPATIDKMVRKQHGGNAIVRSMTGRPSQNRNYYNRGAYNNGRGTYNNNTTKESDTSLRRQNRSYEPIQCKGCGQWGHRVQKCQHIPKVSLAIRFIEKNKTQTEALVKEHLRVNDRNVKRSTVRALQDSGVIDPNIESMQYLQDDDIEVDTFAADFDSDIEQ